MPFRIRQLLTDNDKTFTDRLQSKRRAPQWRAYFRRALRRPRTNGMVERFNGRISEVLASRCFDSREALENSLKRYCYLYSHHIPQRALNHQAPIQAMWD